MKIALLFLLLFAMPLQADTEDAFYDDQTNSAFRLMMDQHVSETIYSQVALQDLILTAEARGWSLDDAKAQRKATEMLKELSVTLRAEVGDNYLGAVLSPKPGQAPMVYIAGAAEESIIDLIPEGVQVKADAPYSMIELKSRQEQLHGILVNFGYKEIESHIDIENSTINATVLRHEDPGLDILVLPASVTNKLPASLQSHITITIESESFVDLEASYGGIDIRNDDFVCTTGWVVKDSSGNKGVTTAGHCPTMTEIEHWGSNIHDVTLEASHFGSDGDISWYLTDTPDDLAYFYFNDQNQVREVNAVEPVSNMVIGETVCFYGRASNSRDCSLTIKSTSANCTFDGLGTVKNMIRMNSDVTIGGDSGGGWSYGNTAYGSHTGDCNGKNIFTPAGKFDDAIGVTVLTQ